MSVLIGLVAGLVVFGFWMNIIGNPHVVETVIGLAILVAVWIVVTWNVRKVFRRFVRSSQSPDSSKL